MIHKTKDGSYVVSSRRIWLPGNYDSERAANYAFRFPDDVLLKLQKRINHRGDLITFADLQSERKQTTSP